MRKLYLASVVLGATLGSATNYTGANGLPVVDLGYELHQASYFNFTGNFFNFSNIRYAAPPLGDLRFAAPQPPAENRSVIETGSQGRVCPQANPAWEAITAQFLQEYLLGQPINITTSGSSSQTTVELDVRTNEDCLFLDVVVPKNILDQAGTPGCKGAPVLVWIYGGGYTGGDKSGSSPAGLLRRSNDSVIYVALNYRLGAFGWLSGPTFQVDGTANAGLHDQRFALEWVQNHIEKFGGDPKRVTVMGESAGGGSIMHQITAYGGIYPVPFTQAIPQSPGFQPVVSNLQQEATFNDFLKYANVSTLAEARQLPTDDLIKANLLQIANSTYGSFSYGPVVDGDFVPKLPGELLLHGQFAKDVKVMVGHNANEGLIFTSPFITNSSTETASLEQTLPDASPAVLTYIDQTLYPVSSYRDATARADKLISELIFECNTYYLDTAFLNHTYSYFFSVGTALHGQDVAYTYYNDGGTSTSLISGVSNVTVALTMQDWIVTFARDGAPSTNAMDVPEGAVPNFQMYGPDAKVELLTQKAVTLSTDDAANERCNWWQKALYY